jgi:FkbM family methyltransferase
MGYQKGVKMTYRLYLNFFVGVIKILFKFIELLPRGRRISTASLEKIWSRRHKVATRNGDLYIATPDWLSKYRAETLLTKEPETIAFLDSIAPGSIFWDVGANIGIYSIYASLKKNISVFCFEPSMMNLELLFRNIQLNGVSEIVRIVPVALSNTSTIDTLYMSANNLHWAGAHNSFGNNVLQDGSKMTTSITSKQLALSASDLIEKFGVPIPRYIKIDVDGLESLVLKGFFGHIASIEWILVEVDDENFSQISEVSVILKSFGFKKIDSAFGHVYTENQLWYNTNLGVSL